MRKLGLLTLLEFYKNPLLGITGASERGSTSTIHIPGSVFAHPRYSVSISGAQYFKMHGTVLQHLGSSTPTSGVQYFHVLCAVFPHPGCNTSSSSVQYVNIRSEVLSHPGPRVQYFHTLVAIFSHLESVLQKILVMDMELLSLDVELLPLGVEVHYPSTGSTTLHICKNYTNGCVKNMAGEAPDRTRRGILGRSGDPTLSGVNSEFFM